MSKTEKDYKIVFLTDDNFLQCYRKSLLHCICLFYLFTYCGDIV